jgi:aspartate ammonia-lyase
MDAFIKHMSALATILAVVGMLFGGMLFMEERYAQRLKDAINESQSTKDVVIRDVKNLPSATITGFEKRLNKLEKGIINRLQQLKALELEQRTSLMEAALLRQALNLRAAKTAPP